MLPTGVWIRWTGTVERNGGLDWTGLDWTGLDWTGMEWNGIEGGAVQRYKVKVGNYTR